MASYLVDSLLANAFNGLLWTLVGWLAFRSSRASKVGASALALLVIGSYVGQTIGTATSATESWVWTAVTAAIGLFVGRLVALHGGAEHTGAPKGSAEE